MTSYDPFNLFAQEGRIHFYHINGKDYIQIIKWWEHQKPQWAMPSKFPPPDGWIDRVRATIKGVYDVREWDQNPSSTWIPHLDSPPGIPTLDPRPRPVGQEIDLNHINQEKENEIHIPPNGGKEKYSQGQIYCLHAFNAKRFKTNAQKEEVANLEIIHRLDLLKKGIDWGAVRGMSMGGTIIERFRQPALVEQFIPGRELYAGILGNDERLQVLPLTELVFDKEKTEPEERIATQAAKWAEPYRKRKGIRNMFARPVSAAARDRIEAICRTAAKALWLRDYARIDLRLSEDDEVWVLEANANPFISKGHEMANAAAKIDLTYPAFIQRIVSEAMARYDTPLTSPCERPVSPSRDHCRAADQDAMAGSRGDHPRGPSPLRGSVPDDRTIERVQERNGLLFKGICRSPDTAYVLPEHVRRSVLQGVSEA